MQISIIPHFRFFLDSMYTQNHIFFCFLSQYIRMENQTQKSVVLKQNMKNLMTSVLPMVKKNDKWKDKSNKIGYYEEDNA